MRKHSCCPLSLSLTFLVALLGSGPQAPAAAAGCGQGVGPCRCGDTVLTSTTLDRTDPVTTMVCACDGLHVAAGVKLDLGRHTISGSGVCVGVRINPQGGPGAVVGGGRIARFGTGVSSNLEGGHSRLHDLQVVENAQGGVNLNEFGSTVEDCVVSGNGGTGIRVSTGNDPPGGGLVQRCRVEDNHGHGIDVAFRGIAVKDNVVRRNTGLGIAACCREITVSLNRVEGNGRGLFVSVEPFIHVPPSAVRGNVALRNRARGMEIGGEDVLVESNESKYNGGEGFAIEGTGHTITLNDSVGNDRDGFLVDGENMLMYQNQSQQNGGTGLWVVGVGHTITTNHSLRNKFDGFFVEGAEVLDSNQSKFNGGAGFVVLGPVIIAAGNVALKNASDGFWVDGPEMLDDNQAKYNGGAGFFVPGTGLTATANLSLGNTGDGFAVDGEGNQFEGNASSYNRGYGIRDSLAGAANVYVDNRCSANVLGTSSPPGLCF